MVSSQSIPWYNVPAREFPITRWLRQRYGFTLPPLAFAPPAYPANVAPPERRRFPALVWLAQRDMSST